MSKIASIDDKLRERTRREVEAKVATWIRDCPAYPTIYNYSESNYCSRNGDGSYSKVNWREIFEAVERKVVALIVLSEQQKVVDKFLEDFDKLRSQLTDLQADFEEHSYD